MNLRWCLCIALAVGVSAGLGCSGESALLLPGRESAGVDPGGLTLVARIAHVSDTHIVDEESPARFAGAQVFTHSAWRPHESYSTQLFDGIIRMVNRIHAGGRSVDFLVHTGDTCDNVQSNELEWFIGVMDGEVINPLSGPDDRPADARPEPELDSHAVFQAQGLYREGQHGELPSIPWYVMLGNHDVYAIGILPIFELPTGRRAAPLPWQSRPGLVLPVWLDPLGSQAYGNVTPADPGPPCLFEQPRYVEPNSVRAYFNKREFIQAMFATATQPPGHGFQDPDSEPSWYSVSPAPGVRLIGLDTNDRAAVAPDHFYHEGALSRAQLAFLRAELTAAQDRGEIVIVASHHPSVAILPAFGSEVAGGALRAVLNQYANVVLHLAGHKHRNRVVDRGGYIEIETCSMLDWPQEGRMIEIWRDETDGSLVIMYEMFSHLNDALPPLGEDPLRAMREAAQMLARSDKGATARQRRFDPSGADPFGRPSDRRGVFVLVPSSAEGSRP